MSASELIAGMTALTDGDLMIFHRLVTNEAAKRGIVITVKGGLRSKSTTNYNFTKQLAMEEE